MKRIAQTLSGLGCLLSVMIAGGQEADGSCNIAWTLGWLAAAALLAWAFSKLSKKEARNV